MADDLMQYDLMAQNALRGVVRQALDKACNEGLPGEHHFYISYRTDMPGVEMSERLRSQYPEEITIVLQHQFWDMEVSDDQFRVSLSFNKVPENLVIPYNALIGFFDPSVQFGLQFVPEGMEADMEGVDMDARNAELLEELGGLVTTESTQDSPDSEPEPAPQGEVVSLDAFRKNNK